jgi:hypothetical protein
VDREISQSEAKEHLGQSSADVEGAITLTTVNGNERVFVPIHTTTKFYEFANGRKLEVFNPRYLNTDNQAHRIICDDGTCLYIKPSEGWFMHWANYTLLDSNYRF